MDENELQAYEETHGKAARLRLEELLASAVPLSAKRLQEIMEDPRSGARGIFETDNGIEIRD